MSLLNTVPVRLATTSCKGSSKLVVCCELEKASELLSEFVSWVEGAGCHINENNDGGNDFFSSSSHPKLVQKCSLDGFTWKRGSIEVVQDQKKIQKRVPTPGIEPGLPEPQSGVLPLY